MYLSVPKTAFSGWPSRSWAAIEAGQGRGCRRPWWRVQVHCSCVLVARAVLAVLASCPSPRGGPASVLQSMQAQPGLVREISENLTFRGCGQLQTFR